MSASFPYRPWNVFVMMGIIPERNVCLIFYYGSKTYYCTVRGIKWSLCIYSL